MHGEFQNFENCSKEVKQQIRNKVNGVSRLLKTNLVGLYLHGSIVLDAFDENSSDLDMAGVINSGLSLADKIELGSLLFSLNKEPCPLELQLFIRDGFTHLKNQPEGHFYFSDYWSVQYEKISSGAENAEEIFASVFFGGEPVSDFAVIKQKGICLFGKPINEVFTDISNGLFFSSVSSNIDDFYVESDNDSQSSFLVLQLCRILSFKKTGEILSKPKAAIWAFEHLPNQYHAIIKTALYNKFRLGSKITYSKEDAVAFKSYMLQKIKYAGEAISAL